MSEMTIPADLLAPPELLPFMTLQEGAEWLVHRGVAKRPKGLIAAASECRIQIFAVVPEGAHHGFISPPSTTPQGRTFTFNVGHRFKRGEMVAVSPDDCVQFLQTGEAHIRDAGGQEWIDAGLPDEWGILLKVLHIDAFRVRGCDLEAFADAQTSTPTPVVSAPAVALPERVALPAKAEAPEVRQARRYQACISAGLSMPTDTYTRLPTGIKRLAECEGITRQAFAEDVKAHIGRLHGR